MVNIPRRNEIVLFQKNMFSTEILPLIIVTIFLTPAFMIHIFVLYKHYYFSVASYTNMVLWIEILNFLLGFSRKFRSQYHCCPRDLPINPRPVRPNPSFNLAKPYQHACWVVRLSYLGKREHIWLCYYWDIK